MTSGDVPGRRPRPASPDDSAEATQLIKMGAPIACPTCGHNRPADAAEGWVCLDVACVWS